MKRTLRRMALIIVVAAIALWLVLGANRGWTKTSVAVVTLDEVTGLEGRTYKKRFVPGVDFLAVAVAGAGVLAGLSMFVRNRKQPET